MAVLDIENSVTQAGGVVPDDAEFTFGPGEQDASAGSEALAAEIDYAGNGEAEDVLEWALAKFSPNIALATSFKDAVLIHMMLKIRPDVRVFALDTGRMNEETYQCAEDIRRQLKVDIEWVFPEREQVEALEREKGMFSFRQSLDNRKECCYVRKVEPLNRALTGLNAWITGIRRDQGVTRKEVRKVEIDHAHGGMVKVNPLADWDQERILNYVTENSLPYNKLFGQGYQSIGCAPCTRPVKEGDDPRSGRWWWESAEHKECGLHIPNFSI